MSSDLYWDRSRSRLLGQVASRTLSIASREDGRGRRLFQNDSSQSGHSRPDSVCPYRYAGWKNTAAGLFT